MDNWYALDNKRKKEEAEKYKNYLKRTEKYINIDNRIFDLF